MELFQELAVFFRNPWVQFCLLVFVATIHGYAGAWLAVRMLFRPRRRVKFLGLTIFPQGMIPRHRDRLAKAIGKAVGEELVSKETVLEELFEKEFLRRKIQSVVESYTEEVLSHDYPSLIEALPSNLRETVLDAISSLQMKIAKHIQNVLKSEESVTSITGFVERRVDEFLGKRVSETIDEEQFGKILSFIESRIKTAVNEPALELKFGDFIDSQIDSLSTTTATVGQIFTLDAVNLLKEKAAEQIEPIIHELTEIATAERTRQQIGALIKREVHDYYEGLPFFKKFFVSRENLMVEVDDLVNESLPRKIEETLRGDFFATEAKAFLSTAIDGVMARPITDILGKVAPEQLERIKSQAKTTVFSLIQGEGMQNSIASYLSDSLQKIRPHSIDAILQMVHPDAEDELKKMLSAGLLNILNQDETVNIINSALSNQIDRLLSSPIGKLSEHLSEEQVRKAGRSVAESIVAAAKEKLPQVIQEFNIGEVVRDKIHNYPVEKLESLVMSVAREHLRTIELFGALFGFIIGFGQAILSYWFFAGK